MKNISLFLFLLLFDLTATAQSSYSSSGGYWNNWNQRAETRASNRWTLQEWLNLKQRNNLMDQWLMMHSPSPFEFYLSGSTMNYHLQKDQLAEETHTLNSGSIAAYAQAVGVIGEYEESSEEKLKNTTGLLSIRVLGPSLQATSLYLNFGQRNHEYNDNSQKVAIKNLTGEVTLQTYITRYFGINGSYRKFFENTDANAGAISGYRTEGGLFIDFSALRISGTWSDERQTNSNPQPGFANQYKRQGIKAGLTIFF